MKRMIKLPSGTWIDMDMIESIEYDIGGSAIFMASGRSHRVRELTSDETFDRIVKTWVEQEKE